MIYKTGDFYACDDCLSWLANGDATGLDYHYNPETAAARLEEIKIGERDLVERFGAIHIGEDNGENGSGHFLDCCDCCGSTLHGHKTPFSTWVDPVGRSTAPWAGFPGCDYLDARFIVEAWRDDKYAGIDFYGSSKAPTSIMVRGADNRARRVWAIAQGNAGSAFVIVGGRRLFIDLETGDRITLMANGRKDSAWLRNGGQHGQRPAVESTESNETNGEG